MCDKDHFADSVKEYEARGLIRANQGHSVEVDLQLDLSPDLLDERIGDAARFVALAIKLPIDRTLGARPDVRPGVPAVRGRRPAIDLRKDLVGERARVRLVALGGAGGVREYGLVPRGRSLDGAVHGRVFWRVDEGPRRPLSFGASGRA
mgnify:CR=1 FL=1